jgi:hypothetical protein
MSYAPEPTQIENAAACARLLYSALCSREGRGAVAFPDELEPSLEDEM